MTNLSVTELETTAQASGDQTETLITAAVYVVSSNEGAIESNTLGGAESICINNDNAETSSPFVNDDDREKSLEFSDELIQRGAAAAKLGDFTEATDCFSRALEIRAVKYGELAPECVNLYYKYGCALLSKAQEEADPLGMVPKKEAGTHRDSDKDESVENGTKVEAYAASASSKAPQDEATNQQVVGDDVTSGKDQEEDENESDVDDLAEVDEDESDLDLAWKMLDVARAIVEKHSGDTMEKVDILSSLAEVALEREDVETSLSDYLKALSVLERLVGPDSRYLAELNFRICLCLEIGSRAEEAIPYCERAISICKSRVERLKREVNVLMKPRAEAAAMEADQVDNQSTAASGSDETVSDKETEIKTVSELSGDLQKKLEDLQHLVSNPTSILSEIMGIVAAKARGRGENCTSSADIGSSQMGVADFGSPPVSNAHSNGAGGVTHLGVVGRGVKRVLMNPVTASNPSKKPAFDPPSDNGESTDS